MDSINCTYSSKVFNSDKGIADLGPEPFVSALYQYRNIEDIIPAEEHEYSYIGAIITTTTTTTTTTTITITYAVVVHIL